MADRRPPPAAPPSATKTAELAQLLAAAAEDDTIERKRALPHGRRHLRTLCAFANGRGGTLVVGVADSGQVVGVHDPRRVLRTLEDELQRHVRPPLPAKVEIVAAPAPARCALVVVRVPPGRDGPYAARLLGDTWQCYVRERDRTVPLTDRAAERIASPRRCRPPDDPRAADALSLLAGVRDATEAGLARALNLSRRRAARLLTTFVRAGWVVEHPESRETRYVLTPQGRAQAAAAKGR